MAYSEIVSFIKEQLAQGRDVQTIRTYLVNRNVDMHVVDSAFDEVYGHQDSIKHSHAGKFVVIGLVFLVLVFIGVGVNLYLNLSDKIETNIVIEQPKPTQSNIPLTQELKAEPKVCNFEDTEIKYQCYISKFEKNEVQCHEIDDYDEREFCYVAQDLYVLNA